MARAPKVLIVRFASVAIGTIGTASEAVTAAVIFVYQALAA
jgi:hypothetical protein